MPYKDPAVRRERRRDYMREFMRRKRAGVSARSDEAAAPVSTGPPVSSPDDFGTASDVSAYDEPALNGRPAAPAPSAPQPTPARAIFSPVAPKQMGLTPLKKAQAAKVWALTNRQGEPAASRKAAHRRFADMAAGVGVTVRELLTAIGARETAP
jgi:hypothetical protein